jgi:parallel beta-helix repeat protein
MKRLAFAIVLVAAVGAGVLLAFNWPRAEASPDVTITVNSTDDTDNRNDKLTLREAMMLATGELSLGELTPPECGQVSGASWFPPPTSSCASLDPPGLASADTVVFDTDDFPPGSPATIFLGDHLPVLNTDGDTVDGSSAGVIVDGLDQSLCFWLSGNGNSIKGLEIYNCSTGVVITGWANTIGGTSSSERNIISGNLYGLEITSSAEDNVVQGNYIGTNAAGDEALPNGSDGVVIHFDARGNTVGGVNPGEGNTIAFNTGRAFLWRETRLILLPIGTPFAATPSTPTVRRESF